MFKESDIDKLNKLHKDINNRTENSIIKATEKLKLIKKIE